MATNGSTTNGDDDRAAGNCEQVASIPSYLKRACSPVNNGGNAKRRRTSGVVGQSTFSIHSLLSQSRNAEETIMIKHEQEKSPAPCQLQVSKESPRADIYSEKGWNHREGGTDAALWLSKPGTSPIDGQIDPLQTLYRSQLAATMSGSVSAGAIGSPETVDDEGRNCAEGRTLGS